ncbi:MAG: FAD-dependent monooxygenase [Micropepsaceae bacterium]
MSAPSSTEILISGGGFAGLTLGLALAGAGYAARVVESGDMDAALAPAFDGRVSAIAPDVRRMLEALGVWQGLPEFQTVTDIVVSGGTLEGAASPFFLHVGESDGGAPAFDMVENRHLRAALLARARVTPGLTLTSGTRIAKAASTSAAVTATLSNGEAVAARLLVAAEGRDSPLREAYGIKTSGWSYRQWGIVCTVEHERPHEGVAQEYFLPSGSFAILPMTGNRSSLVWTEREDLAPGFLALSEADFNAEIARRFTDYLGETKVVGARFGYPLSTLLARDYIAQRFALIGDAAHVVHPLAGQGLNLGLRDAATLAESVTDAGRLGLDIGGVAPLDAYQRRRRIDATLMAATTDTLNRLFANDIAPVRAVSEAGLGLVNAIPPLRRLIARAASGGLDAPRLLQGKAL